MSSFKHWRKKMLEIAGAREKQQPIVKSQESEQVK